VFVPVKQLVNVCSDVFIATCGCTTGAAALLPGRSAGVVPTLPGYTIGAVPPLPFCSDVAKQGCTTVAVGLLPDRIKQFVMC